MDSIDIKQKIKDANDIADVIGEFVTLKKSGVNLVGICPFHPDTKPSMSVSRKKQMYNCFVCGHKGDVISFVQEHENMTFPEAMSYLAKRVGIDYHPQEVTPEQRQRAQQVEALRIVTRAAADYFVTQLPQASDYLKGRGYDLTDAHTANIFTLFGVGYAPDGNTLKTHASKAGYSHANLLATDLLKQGEHGTYDTFRGRLMFPFFDIHGNVPGFTGRIIIAKENVAKYSNTAETPLYTKGKQVYGLYQAHKSISTLGFAYLVEGQMDVIGMHLAGVTNTVAGSGTAFTDDQIRLLGRYTREVVLAYDSDKAGLKASMLNARSFLRAGFTVKCVMLPDGQDPDNLCMDKAADSSKWLINNTVDVISYFYNVMVTDANDVDMKEKALEQLIDLISQIESKTKRNGYCRNLARTSGNDDEVLIRRAEALYKKLPPLPAQAEMQPGIYGLDELPNVVRQNEYCHLTTNHEELLAGYGEEPILYLHGELSNSDVQILRKAHSLYSCSSTEIKVEDDGTESTLMSSLALATRAGIQITVCMEDMHDDDEEEQTAEDFLKKKSKKSKKPTVSDQESFINFYVYAYWRFLCTFRGDKTPYVERCAELISYASESARQVNMPNYASWLDIPKAALQAICKPHLDRLKSRVALSAQRQDDLSDDDADLDPDEIPAYVEENPLYMRMYKECRYYPRLNKQGDPVCYIFEENNRKTQVGDFYMEPLLHINGDKDEDNKRVFKINRRYYTQPLFIEVQSTKLLKKSTIEERLINLEAVNFTNGEEKHWVKIREFMSRQYVTCTEIMTYGNQQVNGFSVVADQQFFAFSNGIFHIVDNQPQFDPVNELGVVSHNGRNYYLPAFSAIYAGSGRANDKYETISTLMYREVPAAKQVSFLEWATLMDKVYKINHNGKWAVIFAVMCAFRSNIHCIDRLFTAPFFMGPMSSGKTQIAVSIRSLFISPMVPIFNLVNGSDAAMSTMMSTFRDVPIVLDEYNNNEITDTKFQALKGIVYDGDGKQKRKGTGTTELVIDKVFTPVIICGQETPQRDDNALMSRIIVCEVPKPANGRTAEEVELFDRLKEIEDPEKVGLSNILLQVLQLRPTVMKHFKNLKKEAYNELKKVLVAAGEIDRLMKTASLFLATTKLIEDYSPLQLPFTYAEFFQIAIDKIKFQVELISKTDKLATFFKAMDVMIDAKTIVDGRDFSIEQKSALTIKTSGQEKKEVTLPSETRILFLRVSSVYTMFARTSFNRGDSSQSTIEQNIRSHPSYIGVVASKRFRWHEIEEVPNGDFTTGTTPEGVIKEVPDNRVSKRYIEKSTVSSCVALNYDIFRELYDIELQRSSGEDQSATDQSTADSNASQAQPLPF
jgi:DNA primase catalytic core